MSIKSFIVAAVIGLTSFAVSGCVSDSGRYYYDDGRYYGSGYYAGTALVYESGPRYVHPRASRRHRAYRPHHVRGPRYERRETRRDRREWRRQESRAPRNVQRQERSRRAMARSLRNQAVMEERAWP